MPLYVYVCETSLGNDDGGKVIILYMIYNIHVSFYAFYILCFAVTRAKIHD